MPEVLKLSSTILTPEVKLRYCPWIESVCSSYGVECVQYTDQVYANKPKVEDLEAQILQGNRPVLVLSGPSGAGKDAVLRYLIERNQCQRHFKRIVTATARSRRDGEDEAEYIWLNQKQFDRIIENDGFIEYVNYVGRSYGTIRSIVKRMMDNKNIEPVFRVDPKGIVNLLQKQAEGEEVFQETAFINIMIMPESELVIAQRLYRREVEEKPEDKKFGGLQTVEKRLDQLATDLSNLNHAHFLIINRTGELDKTVEALEAIYEGCMTVRSING